jgi:hypothetical protein
MTRQLYCPCLCDLILFDIWCFNGRITLGWNMASLEAYNGAGKIHTMGGNLPVKLNELPVNIMIPCLIKQCVCEHFLHGS